MSTLWNKPWDPHFIDVETEAGERKQLARWWQNWGSTHTFLTLSGPLPLFLGHLPEAWLPRPTSVETTGCPALYCVDRTQKRRWGMGRETPLGTTKGVRWSWRPDRERGEVDRSWGQGTPKGETQRQTEGQGHTASMGDQGCSRPPQSNWRPCQPMSQSPWSGPESPRRSSPSTLAEETCPHMQGAGKHSPTWPDVDSPAWGPWEALRALPCAANQPPQCCWGGQPMPKPQPWPATSSLLPDTGHTLHR